MTNGNRHGPAPLWCRAVALLASVTALLLVAPPPAYGHDAVILTVHGDGRGSVWMTAAWVDEHPITEPIGALLTATSTAGRRIGPAPLRQNGGALTYSGTLPPGEWTVVAEMGTPAIGRCQAVLRVADADASPLPTETRCAPSAVAAPSAPPPPSRSSSLLWYVLTAALVAALAAGATLWLRARHHRRAPKQRTPKNRRR